MLLRFVPFFSLTLVACGAFEEEKDGKVPVDPNAPLEYYTSDVTKMTYASNVASAETKVFLIAGSREAANFGQEIVEQKALWLSRGVSEGQIACYFVIPDKVSFDNDKTQYLSLASELSKCAVANAAQVRSDLLLASGGNSDFVYIYVTSHGDYPLSKRIAATTDPEQKAYFENALQRLPFLDQYLVSLDAVGEKTLKFSDILAYANSTQPEDLIFTPGYLQQTLNSYSASTKKYVTIQACYSGGFVYDPNPTFQADTLAHVTNLVAMTAAIYNRPSFGCGEGDERTYFGDAFLNALKETSGLPTGLNWQSLYESVKQKVTAKESELGNNPSLPQFLSTL